MLDILTFDSRRGGNVLYKALTHPLAAEAIGAMAGDIGAGRLAVFDPDGVAPALFALHPELPAATEYYVQDVDALGKTLNGLAARPLQELGESKADILLIASFDAARILQRFSHLIAPSLRVISLDAARLPQSLLTNPRNVVDKLNYATNFAFFRDAGSLSTRLVSANYWSGYGAREVKLWLRLFDEAGHELATWQQDLAGNSAGFSIDSREVRTRFNLPEFCGQLFVHAIGVAGHDVVKYALDIYGQDGNASLSVTHDANAWPSDRYAGLPAPNAGERVILWIQNSHAAPIPAGAISIDRMGAQKPVAIAKEIAPFASMAIDVAEFLPGLAWPAQIEVRSGRHVVRPRYEITRQNRTRIAHINVERADLAGDPAIKSLPPQLGRGFLLPFPVLDPAKFRTLAQPNPMSERITSLPLRLDIFSESGALTGQKFLGNLARDHDLAVDVSTLAEGAGHAELVYDFRDGGEADGWPHGLFRYESRTLPHAAETSFGGHIFNTAMTWRDEPQSYAGPPPGLSTRLFLKLGYDGRKSFCVLIYAASSAWHALSSSTLLLINSAGETIAEAPLQIACSGSRFFMPHEIFGDEAISRAGANGYVLIRDATCRLFGYHGVMDANGGFALDHMFGF